MGRMVTFEEVRSAWVRADSTSKNPGGTPGILAWFTAPFALVSCWERVPLTAAGLAELYVIGGPVESEWGTLSRGTFRVSECSMAGEASAQALPPELTLTALRRPGSDRLVLIDGNKRAMLLWHWLEAGKTLPSHAALHVGTLGDGSQRHIGDWFLAAAAAVSPLWR
jgi:hypothetical protein